MKLSIITPYYKTLEPTLKLAEVLEPQLTDDVEWVIVDDGCHEQELDKLKAKVIHLEHNSGGASKPRNIGLDSAKGKYIAFIDSDDIVTEDYIETILSKLGADIIYISWRSQKHDIVMINRPPQWNCAVWCRVYKREIIGNTRFDETLKLAEDWKFNRNIKPKTSSTIRKQIYIYDCEREGSLTRG